MKDLVVEMAKVRRNNAGAAVRWEHLSDGVQALEIADMKAALEILKNPPDSFIETMAASLQKQLWDDLTPKSDVTLRSASLAALQAAIIQALKEGENA